MLQSPRKWSSDLLVLISCCLNACFMSDHQTFRSLFKVRHVIWCINHDIILGLCSELFMRLSYYIRLEYGKKLSSHMGIEPRFFRLWAVYSTPRPECCWGPVRKLSLMHLLFEKTIIRLDVCQCLTYLTLFCNNFITKIRFDVCQC